jgi:hypothetical protein
LKQCSKAELRTGAKKILEERGKQISSRSVLNYRKRDELKPFHVISKRFKSQINIDDRLFFADWLSDWSSEDFI